MTYDTTIQAQVLAPAPRYEPPLLRRQDSLSLPGIYRCTYLYTSICIYIYTHIKIYVYLHVYMYAARHDAACLQ